MTYAHNYLIMNSSELKNILKKFDWSQSELAEQLGISKSLVSMWINEKTPIGDKFAISIQNLIARVESDHRNAPHPYHDQYTYDLTAFRKALRLKQSDLSEATGLSQSFISLVENGVNELSMEHMELLKKKYPSIDNYRVSTSTPKLDFDNLKTITEMKFLLHSQQETIESQKKTIMLLEEKIRSLQKDNLFSTKSDPIPDEGNPEDRRAN